MSMREAGTATGAFKEAGSTEDPGPYIQTRALDWRALSANRCPVDGEDLTFFEHVALARCKLEACGFYISLLAAREAAKRIPIRGYGFGSHHAHTPF